MNDQPAISKASLRALCRAQRAALKPEARRIFAVTFAQRFLQHIEVEGKTIACYWPTGDEMDARLLLDRLEARSITCCLPVSDEETYTLAFHRWDLTTPMINGPHHIAMPDPRYSKIMIPDIIVVPLLGFDSTGHRLGYGAGYYDRTLAQLREQKHKFLTVGAAYACQQLDTIPADEHDVPLDMIITEEAVMDCRSTS